MTTARRIAVAGASGTVGRHVVAAVAASGHIPVPLTRCEGVDLVSGVGLADALAQADAVIDVSNVAAIGARESSAFFEAATANLIAATTDAGVRHLVALSIVGSDRVDFGYYLGKRRQEHLLLTSGRPVTVLRSTQFHEFPVQLLGRAKGPIAVIPRMTVQPVAAREVARALVRVAVGGPVGLAPELAGPEVHQVTDLARQWLRARASHRLVVPWRLPGAVGAAMAGGALLPRDGGTLGTQTFAEWLAEASPGP